MPSLKKEAKVGLVTVIVLATVVVLLFINPAKIFKSYNTYTVILENAGGLHPGSPVVIGSANRGFVREIQLNEEGSGGVALKIKVESKVHLPDNSTAGVILWKKDSEVPALSVSLQGSTDYLEDKDTVYTDYLAGFRLRKLADDYSGLGMDSLINHNNIKSSGSESDTVYKIQILVSKNELPSGHSEFRGLKDVDHYIQDGVYKYTWGAFYSWSRARIASDSIKMEGFVDAFVIKTINGKRIN